MTTVRAAIRSTAPRNEQPVLPTGLFGRTGRLLALPVRHAASRLSSATTEQIATRSAEQVFATLGEFKGGATKPGQAMSVFEAALPENIADPYRSTLTRLANATPAMAATVARRVLEGDLSAAYGPAWRQRLIDFDETPAATASIGQVHRGRWRHDRDNIIDVAVKGQYLYIYKPDTASQPVHASESRPAMTTTTVPIPSETGGGTERAVLPTGMVRRTSRLLGLPVRHAARTVAAATRLSNATTEQIAARSAEQVFTTLGELKGGATKLGQALSVFEAALPEHIAAPYRSSLNRLADATPAMPAAVAHRILASDLTFAYGPDWCDRLVDFDDTPAASASIGQVHRGRWRDSRGNVIDVAVKVQYPGIAKALRSDLRAARMLGRIMARATGLDIGALTDELVARFVDELDYIREGHVQNKVAAAFARPLPKSLIVARAAGAQEPPGRTSVVVPHVYAATPRVLVSRWLDGAPLTALLNDGANQLPSGWRDLSRDDAANLAARLIGHAAYAPAACTGWMHADPHPGNFLLLPDNRLGLLDFGSVASMPDGPPEPLGRLAAAVLADDGPAAVRWARQAGTITATATVDPGLLLELLAPIVAPTADATFTYSPTWLRALMTHLTQPRFAGIRREMTTPLEYALTWRGVLSVAGLYAQLCATVPSRGFELAYSPGFRHATNSGRPLERQP